MIDVKTTNTGDLIIAAPEKYQRLNFKWRYCSYPAFRLLMKSGRAMEDPPKAEKDQLSLKFGLGVKVEKNRCATVKHEDELQQRVMTRLRTELTDISGNKEYGTTIYHHKHKDIISKQVQDTIRDIVLDAVSDILDNPSVIVRKKKIDGPFFCQNLNIYIYDGKKEIYNFELEEG